MPRYCEGKLSEKMVQVGERLGWWGRLFGPRREIDNYWDGNVEETRPVYIGATGAVTGDVVAPFLSVDGLLCGVVLAREVVVRPGGQVWGDVHAATLRVSPGGRCYGTVIILDGDQFQKAAAAHAATGAMPEPPDDPSPLVGAWVNAQEAGPQAIWQVVRREVASAVRARQELERAFDRRLKEAAGDIGQDLRRSREELEEREAALARSERELADIRQRLRAGRDELARCEAARREVEDRLAALTEAWKQTKRRDPGTGESRERIEFAPSPEDAGMPARAGAPRDARIKELEAEAVWYQQQLDAQGQRLAEARAALAEEAAGRQKAARLAQTREEQLGQLYRRARARVEALEAALDRAREKREERRD